MSLWSDKSGTFLPTGKKRTILPLTNDISLEAATGCAGVFFRGIPFLLVVKEFSLKDARVGV